MVELNHRERTIKVKIVYYGPPIGGKTTNLQVLHQYAQASRRGELVSINSAQDRTILFDLLPMKTAGFRGFDLRLQILAVPGQAMYAATRRLVLKGADSLVFVVNSAADRWEENLSSFREMTQNLIIHQLDPAAMPLVLQYNKRDLPEVTPIEFIDRALNARRVDAIPAIAVRGEGVLETFSAILMRTMQDLAQRYRILETRRGQTLQQWTQQTIVGLFGTSSLALEPNPLPAEPPPPPPVEAPPPERPSPAEPSREAEPTIPAPVAWAPLRRTMKIALPEDAVRMAGAGPDARANETLVESYAQASTQLSNALEEMREERDLMRRRFDDLQQILSSAQEIIAGQPLEPTLRSILARMADAVNATHASFLVQEADKSLRTLAMRGGLRADPLLHVPAGDRHVRARLLGETEPRVHQAADSLDLGDALESQEPRFGAVTVVPLRSPRALLGLAMLYHPPDAALPRADVLAHLSLVSRALSASLELARALDTVRSAERSLQLALAGTASVHGLEEVVRFLEAVRDEFGSMRRRSDVPPSFLQEFVRLAPGLAGALSTARSLLAFSRGEIRREAVVIEDLVAELEGPGLPPSVGPGVPPLLADAALLRLAIKALVDHAGGPLRPGTPPPSLSTSVTSSQGRVRLAVTGPAAPTGPSLALSFVRRVADLHGATLAIESDGSSGTRYTLNLVPASP
jgi:signal recognition particle receptor subunit beta